MKRMTLISMFVDFMIFLFSLYMALWLRFNGAIPLTYVNIFWKTAFLIALGKCLIFFFTGIYRIIVKFVQTYDVINILKSNFMAFLFFSLTVLVLKSSGFLYPRSTIIIDFLLSFILTVGMRYILKYFLHNTYRKPVDKVHHSRVLIIGAGEAGSMVLREIRSHPDARMKVMGFIDDDENKRSMSVGGKHVLGDTNDILKLVEKKKINLLIIAIPSAHRQDINKIIERCEHADVQLKIVPSTYEIIAGNVRFEQIRDIKIEELLSREEIRFNAKIIEHYLRNKVVLVTGAGGSIGSEIARQICAVDVRKVILLGKGENSIFSVNAELVKNHPKMKIIPVIADVRDPLKMRKVFMEYKPHVVFHAAAHKHVHLMEFHPDEAVKNNVLGTLNLVQLSMEHRVRRFVLISTDKAVNPESVMGMTKRIAEKILIGYSRTALKKGCRLMAVRFGNVLGSRGSVVPIFKEQIEAGGPVTVTHPEVERYFMTIPEAVQLVLQAGGYGKGGEIFILEMGKPVKIVDLARKMISLSGYVPEKDIKIVYTGLKSGEKIKEELVSSSEDVDKTRYEKILITKSRPVKLKKIINQVRHLEKAVLNLNRKEIKKQLRQLI